MNLDSYPDDYYKSGSNGVKASVVLIARYLESMASVIDAVEKNLGSGRYDRVAY